MKNLRFTSIFSLAALSFSLFLAGCSESQNEVIVDTEKTPEEVQAEYDNYDNQQLDENYE